MRRTTDPRRGDPADPFDLESEPDDDGVPYDPVPDEGDDADAAPDGEPPDEPSGPEDGAEPPLWTTADGHLLYLPPYLVERLLSRVGRPRPPRARPATPRGRRTGRRRASPAARRAVVRRIGRLARGARRVGTLRHRPTGRRYPVFGGRARGRRYSLVARPRGMRYEIALVRGPGTEPESLERELTGRAPAPGRTVDPVPSTATYVELARKLVRQRRKRGLGIVLSAVVVSPTDWAPLIDTTTETVKGKRFLKNPPAHVVLPAEVHEIVWKTRRKKISIQYIWILSNEKAAFPVGGILFFPYASHDFTLVTFNVGSLDRGCTNAHHAEMQATRFVNEQPKPWRGRVGQVHVVNLSVKKGLGYSPCNPCCVDLARFLTDLRALRSPGHDTGGKASITWLTLYDRNKACGHPTDAANLRKLAAAGWVLNGPGWPVGGGLVTLLRRGPGSGRRAPSPRDVPGHGGALKLAGRAPDAAKRLLREAETYRRGFAIAFGDTLAELTEATWRSRLDDLARPRGVPAFRGLPGVPRRGTTDYGAWERWAPGAAQSVQESVRVTEDDYVTRFRANEVALLFALAAHLAGRLAKGSLDRARGTAHQQAAAAGMAAAAAYVRSVVRVGGADAWSSVAADVRKLLPDRKLRQRRLADLLPQLLPGL